MVFDAKKFKNLVDKKKPVSLLQSLKQNWYFVTEIDIYFWISIQTVQGQNNFW